MIHFVFVVKLELWAVFLVAHCHCVRRCVEFRLAVRVALDSLELSKFNPAGLQGIQMVLGVWACVGLPLIFGRLEGAPLSLAANFWLETMGPSNGSLSSAKAGAESYSSK